MVGETRILCPSWNDIPPLKESWRVSHTLWAKNGHRRTDFFSYCQPDSHKLISSLQNHSSKGLKIFISKRCPIHSHVLVILVCLVGEKRLRAKTLHERKFSDGQHLRGRYRFFHLWPSAQYFQMFRKAQRFWVPPALPNLFKILINSRIRIPPVGKRQIKFFSNVQKT